MRERLRLINGEFTIRSQPGQGTTITARVPIVTASPAMAAAVTRTA
jgi:signal transduction histidine kinase